MDWIPIVFVIFKVIVLGIGMFFAIKWHYDQDKKAKKIDALRAVGSVVVIFSLSLLMLMCVVFTLAKMLNLELPFL